MTQIPNMIFLVPLYKTPLNSPVAYYLRQKPLLVSFLYRKYRANYNSCIYIPSHPVCKWQCVCMRMCLSVHSGSFICILSQAGRQAGFWQGPELWNGLSLQFCRWLDQPIPLYLAEGSPNPIAAVLFCEILFHFTTLTDKKRAHTLVPAQKTPRHIYLAEQKHRENNLYGTWICLNAHIVSCKYNHLHIYTFFHTRALTQCTAERSHTHTHPCTRACHLRRHTDTNPIIRARRWQTTQPWVVVKTKAIHILRNERSVQLTLFLPCSPDSPLSFLLQIICTRKPSIFLQLCDF